MISLEAQLSFNKSNEIWTLGRIDQNGDIKATFDFHPCNGCEDKLVVFDGNINKKKLSGMYHDTPIYFYLVKI